MMTRKEIVDLTYGSSLRRQKAYGCESSIDFEPLSDQINEPDYRL